MFKKLFSVVSIVCVIVASVASTSLAGLSYSNKAVDTIYNGAAWGQRGRVDATATGQNYSVIVGIEKNGVILGTNTTTVFAGNTQRCYSKFVQGSGGTLYLYPDL